MQETNDFETNVLLDNLKAIKSKKLEKLNEKLQNCNEDNARNKVLDEIDKLEEDFERQTKDILSRNLVDPCGNKKLQISTAQSPFYTPFLPDFLSSYSSYHNIPPLEIHNFLLKNSYFLLGLHVPKEIWDSLFEYQKGGVKWLLGLFTNEVGGILADDMGLGKTIQTIAFITILFFNKKINNCVILCPVTVIDQWHKEWIRIFPLAVNDFNIKNIQIMSYEKFKTLKRKEWDLLVLDEGHKIKNKEAKITKHLKSFSLKNKFVLTGTPIQNNLGELWSLMDFVNPGLLGPYTVFKDEFETPISQGGYQRASVAKQEIAYKYSLVLKGLIDPFILRRVKEQINIDLPSKIDKIYFCSLTPKQLLLYKQTIESELIARVISGEASIFTGIDVLRKICNHPILLEKENQSFDVIQDSSKMILLHEMLSTWKKENVKVLIFSQRVKMLNLIEESLKEYKYLRMDGDTPSTKRGNIIDQFNTDQSIMIFLLTSRVGGLGLNLVAASRIVIFDPDWNPATDNQAKERVWRYGQKKEVEIYRFISKDTIEEKIYRRQIFKNALSNKILKNATFSSSVDKVQLEDLFECPGTKSTPGVKIENNLPEETVKLVKLDFVRENDKEEIKRIKELMQKKVMSGKDLLEYIFLREKQLKKGTPWN